MEDTKKVKKIKPLTRDELIGVIEGAACAKRVPINYHFWINTDSFGVEEGKVLEILDRYPEDFQVVSMTRPSVYRNQDNQRDYSWLRYERPEDSSEESLAMDNVVAIKEWEDIDFDEVVPNINGIENIYENIKVDDNRYLLVHWWYGLFESHWSVRGMTNALMDFYLYPNEVKKLYKQFTKHFIKMIDKAILDLKPNGIFFSDDLGTQDSTFFSIDIFREFFKPYYQEISKHIHSNDMHFWLHSCGNIESFIEDFIEIGIDVLHPIQKHTMNGEEISAKYGGRICIWAGVDVQQVIPWGSNEEVYGEVRNLIDIYNKPSGRLILTAGNGINDDARLDAIEELFIASLKEGEIDGESSTSQKEIN